MYIFGGMPCRHEEGYLRPRREGPGTGPSLKAPEGSSPSTPWLQTSSLQNDEPIHLCCLSHPPCGTLLSSPGRSIQTPVLCSCSLLPSIRWPASKPIFNETLLRVHSWGNAREILKKFEHSPCCPTALSSSWAKRLNPRKHEVITQDNIWLSEWNGPIY